MQSVVDFLTQYAQIVTIVVGLLTPAITAVVLQPTWTKRQRTTTAAIVSLIVGFLTAATTGQIAEPDNLAATLVVIYVASEAAYQKLWGGGLLPAIERGTSPSAPDESV